MRPKRGTPSGDRATEKWHDTMLKKLGSEEAIVEYFRTMGRKGGSVPGEKGFGSFTVGRDGMTGYQRARVAGARGGKRSRRTGVHNGEGKKRREEDEFIESILES